MSSRIFVRGLPPNLSEDDFKKHFSQLIAITDARLLPQRRIGYVGFSTPEDAASAVKYFNKSFIRMSKIGVEIAQPVAEKFKKFDSEPDRALDTRKRSSNSSSTAAIGGPRGQKRKRISGRDSSELTRPSETFDFSQRSSSGLDLGNESKNTNGAYADRPRSSSTSAVPDKDNIREPSLENGVANQRSKTESNDSDWLRNHTKRVLDLESSGEDENPDREDMLDSSDNDQQEVKSTAHQDISNVPSEDSTEVEKNDLSRNELGDDANEDRIKSTGRLFLRNISYNVTVADIREYFKDFGDIEEVEVPIGFTSETNKGFAYVQFKDPEQALRAYHELDGTIFQGRLLHVLPSMAKRTGLDQFAISKLPLKKQRLVQRKAEAASSTFNWNSLYMNADAVVTSVSERLGIPKSAVLDPTSTDAAVKQAHAETHVIQETKAYFAEQGVDLNAFNSRERGDTAILAKNLPYSLKSEELKTMFEEHGKVMRFLLPPAGTMAIVEFVQAQQAQRAFRALAYRKIKDSVLFLEKAPRHLFNSSAARQVTTTSASSKPKPSTSDLLGGLPPLSDIETSTLFVRNLNFDTSSDRLTEAFKPLDGFLSARVKTKTNPKRPGQMLSMGFGFVEFRTQAQAQSALATMDGYSLDSHQLQLRASHKGLDAAAEKHRKDRLRKAAARSTKIVIKNLPFQTTKKDVRSLFGAYGQLRSVRVPKKFDKGARGFAFAEFTTPREAESAMNALRDTHLLGRRLVLDFAAEELQDAEAVIEDMQKKTKSQANKIALQELTGTSRKKFVVGGVEEDDN
ncbi:MAG: Multiple RNA-binding domain-containing protein 1 [Bogoriella megaspora]|nr:MAG: Multiple RNA-binding domain-containing protein 1 [Bogoriella megaspora]